MDRIMTPRPLSNNIATHKGIVVAVARSNT